MKLFRLLLSREWKDGGSVSENVLNDEERYSWDRVRLARDPSNRVELSKF